MFDRFAATVAAGICLASCGSSSSPVAPTPSPGPPAPGPPAPGGPVTVTITTTGFSPTEVTVTPGGRVTFVNGDRFGREVISGLYHVSRDCPEVDVVGFLGPGESRDTAVLDQAKTCRFHEHANLGNPAYQGRIVVR